MESQLQTRIDLFVSNAEVARRAFAWRNTHATRLAVILYTGANRVFNADAVRACNDRIKQNTGIFSTFRGNSSLSLATMLALSPDPQKLLDDAMDVYERLKHVGFHASDFLTIAAFLIAEHADERIAAAPASGDTYWKDASVLDRFAPVVTRAKAFFDGMKEGHWFITGQDDYIFAAMLGLSELAVESGVAQIERLFEELKPEFRGSNSVQALAQVLALGGDAMALTSRVRVLSDGFREVGLRLDREYTLSTLGVLAMLPQDRDTVVRTVQDTFNYLREQPRFGRWSVDKRELLLYATSLFAFDAAADMRKGLLTSTVSTSITSIIIAQQAAMAAAIAASTAASSAAASASH